MMPDSLKIAGLAMLSLTEAERIRLENDMTEILSAGESMPLVDGGACSFRGASLEELRDDVSVSPSETAVLLSLSEKERNGYIVVSRTVGGSV